MVAFSFVACNSQNQANAKEINELKNNIGQTKEVVFKNLKLEEGKDIEQFNGKAGIYAFKKQHSLYGEPLTLTLMFDLNNDKLYGFMYAKGFKDQNQGAYDLTKKLYTNLSKAFGDPTTNPGVSDRISKIPGYEDLPKKSSYEYFDSWKVDDELNVELRLNILGDQDSNISVAYKVNTSPEDWNK
ncbi:hypothetical protein J23TS9_41760 [Paenibacillus sp. J23TS9]|uniref:hypothetical protein n=1 Tax=Paenibacillus sp. J23TS9 TaxID=2807193 RepID=UPI001AFD1A19|nr:hypothetical protein [Paenibacillus sp. J23TS9]GIP29046.1 hypothetical protein J23TS9_41760 [Paenibacillus sp. J23TS9]